MLHRSSYNNNINDKFTQDIDIIAAYSDASGHIRLARLKTMDLSASWVWENPTNVNTEHQNNSQVFHLRYNLDLNI